MQLKPLLQYLVSSWYGWF